MWKITNSKVGNYNYFSLSKLLLLCGNNLILYVAKLTNKKIKIINLYN
jgi:hypothetical protein